ncbi:hypothetical protein OSB04_029856 [Centaurea solstitialis]|uniref:Carotenoid cleavage dioxygenase 4 n=1 Tax=Centaurea solstitialis TaxID=347529 RepID=A0AA38SE13_9ASTR|nr:hypothetical protein OSB04_029856 [Centaurea solstitialis]
METLIPKPSLFHSCHNSGFRKIPVNSRPSSSVVSVSRINDAVHELKTKVTPKRRNSESLTPDSRKPSSAPDLLEKVFRTLENGIIKFLDPPLQESADPRFVLSDNFAPVGEVSPTECEVVHGSIPTCLEGVYIRNGPNPQFAQSGPYHFFDGDGMVHAVKIFRGRATFCSRFVKTNKYLHEHRIKSTLVPNLIVGVRGLGPFVARAALFAAQVVSGKYDIGKGIGVANTSIFSLGGNLYALCESDLPYAIEVKDDGDVVTLGRHDFDGQLSTNMTAHPKTDPATNETFAFRCGATRPYLTYFWFDSNGNKQPDVPIFSMNYPSLTHDLAITGKYAIVCEIQMGANPGNLVRGGRLVDVNREKVSRIGVLPRYAKDESEMRWFEVAGFNIFHAVNAWDETDEHGGDVVVLVAPNILSVEHFFERPDLIRGSMEKVTINVETGVVSRHRLSTAKMEFPVINPAYVAKKNKYVYVAVFEESPIKSKMMRASGVAKLDIAASEGSNVEHECTVGSRMYGDNCFGGEPFFIAREPDNPDSEEDDGFVVSYVRDESSGVSSFMVMDAQTPNLEVVAVVKLPQRVPYGLHGTFIRATPTTLLK